MINIKESWYAKDLACPDCQQSLVIENDIQCEVCGYKVDLKLPIEIKPKLSKPLLTIMPRTITNHPIEILEIIETNRPEITYKGSLALRDSRELMSEISRYIDSGGTVLDLGCGPRDQAVPIKYLGYKYVGVDYTDERADFLADGHAIPFKDSTFDCVLSYAVLEHLHNPFIAIQEIERVLKPGGIYVGAVSQGEPFHASYFHHTPWGFLSLISATTGMRINRLWSSGDTLASLSRIGRYPKAIRALIKITDKLSNTLPFLAPRKMKWNAKEKSLDELYRAGSICFVVQRPRENHT